MTDNVIVLPVVRVERSPKPDYSVKTTLAPDVFRALVTYCGKNRLSPSVVVAEACRAYMGLDA